MIFYVEKDEKCPNIKHQPRRELIYILTGGSEIILNATIVVNKVFCKF